MSCIRCNDTDDHGITEFQWDVDAELCPRCVSQVLGDVMRHPAYEAYHEADQLLKLYRRQGCGEQVPGVLRDRLAATRVLHDYLMEVLYE